jgi:transcriptional regulator with XRE-family HTH domain
MPANPRPVDVHVGRRLRERRTLLGMSQERLAELLGVTYQQVQKYERGANRIGSSRLHDIARYLDVPVAWFFAGLDEPESRVPGLAEGPAAFTFDAPAPSQPPPRETAELVRAFTAIREPEVRRRLVDLVRTLAAASRRDGRPGSA